MKSGSLAVAIWAGILVTSADWRLLAFLSLAVSLVFRSRPKAPLLFGLLLGSAIYLIHSYAIASSEIKEFIGRESQVTGVVATDPTEIGARVIGSRLINPHQSMIVRAESVQSGARSISLRIPIRVITAGSTEVVPGDSVSINGKLSATKEPDVSALLVASEDVVRTRPLSGIRQSLEKVRIALREVAESIGGDSAALLPGLAIGDTSLQSAEFSELMRQSGLSHLTAVSGANFAIVSAFIFYLLGFALPQLIPRIFVTAIFLFLFVLLVRPTPSVLRAAVMAGIFLISRASGSRRNALSTLAGAVSILLLINPFQAFEPGFILSVLATSGLIFLAPKIQERIARWTPNWLAELVAIAISASVFCTPYLMFFAGKVSIATIPANVLVAPVVPFVTILVFIAALVVVPFPFLAEKILHLANFGSTWIVQVSHTLQGAPAISANPVIALLGAAIAIFLLLRGLRKWSILILTLLLVISFPRQWILNNDWQVAQCDVGQGDALLINLGFGAGALFDAGPDPKLLDQCLEEFGVKRLPLVVISHRHADHFAGIAGIGKRPVGEYWVNASDKIFEGLPNVRIISTGLTAEVGELHLEALWPKDSELSFQNLAGDGSAENNRSLVIRAEIHGLRILITGDIEPEVQAILAREHEFSDVDILKVPHHGSKFQDSAFLEELSPQVALISVGQNSYGHPNSDVIANLTALGTSVFRSDQAGAIALSSRLEDDEPIISARSEGKEWWRILWH